MTGNLIEKSLKRYSKRKVKITLGLITAFLITGAVSFSAVEIGYDNINGKITVDGEAIEGDTWTNDKDNEINDEINLTRKLLTSGIVLNIENNGKILSNDSNGINITVADTSFFNGKIGRIINNGIIEGYVSDIQSYFSIGNGINIFSFSGDIVLNGNIINNGIIKGYSKNSGGDCTGNGISIYSFSEVKVKLESIINNGIIKGNGNETPNFNIGNGIGIFNHGGINTNIINNGIIEAYGNNSKGCNIGNGIGIFSNCQNIDLKNHIINNGTIKGYGEEINSLNQAINAGNGIGILNVNEGSFTLNKINNKGIITGQILDTISTTTNGGNGLFYSNCGRTLNGDTVINNGIFSGYSAKDISINSTEGNGLSIYSFIELSDFSHGDIEGKLELKKIFNTGMIEGYTFGNIDNSSNGNGLSIYNIIFDIEDERENKAEKTEIFINLHDIINNGSLIGTLVGTVTNNSSGGNGLGIYNGSNYNSENTKNGNEEISLKDISNEGVMSGYINDDTETSTGNFGNGLGIYNNINKNTTIFKRTITLNNLTNTGLIIGSEHGVYLKDVTFKDNPDDTTDDNKKVEYINYGVVGGKEAVKIEGGNVNETNLGLYLTFDDKGEVTTIERAESGEATIGTEKYIISGELATDGTINIVSINSSDLDSKIEKEKLNKYKNENGYHNLILNGVDNTLTVNQNTTLTDSTINAYKNAVLFEEKKDSFNSFTGNNVIINGGGLRIKDENGENVGTNTAVTGSGNKDVFTLKGNSILNGDVNMNGGDDEVSFDNEVQINGNLDGGDGADILNLGINGSDIKGNLESTFDSSLRIYNNITGFETIKIKDNVTVFETAKIKGTGNLVIEKGNQLNLRIDGTKKEGDIIVGHALYNSGLNITGTVDSSTDDTITEGETNKYEKTGILNLVTSGLGTGSVISFGKTSFDTENVWVKTDNLLDNVTINGSTATIEGEKDIFKIIAKADPSDPSDTSGKLYEKLNEVYKGAYSSGDENFIELKNIIANAGIKGDGDYTEVTDEQQLKTLLAYLKEIYTNSPYSFTSDASRKSMGMFRDIIRENNFKALDDEWIIYGGLTHNDGSREQTYYGKNYHKFDTEAYDNSADIKITGAYAQAEYGIDNTLSAGVLFGGNKSDIEVSHSKADGTSMYLGGYLKKDIRNFRITGEAGIQYSEYDAERNMSNRQYDDKYSDNAFDVYINTKYFYEISEGLFFEPYGQFSYSYVDQEEISENDGALSLNVDDKDFTFAEGTIGADLRKEIIKDNIKHNFKAGVSYTRLLDGYKEDNLTADFGGSSFELLVPHKTPDELRIGVRYELERTDGLMFSANADYLISMASKDNGHKNENKDEWRIGAGIGYRF